MDEKKRAFAVALLESDGNALFAGQTVYPNDFNEAAKAASTWRCDPEVLQYVEIAGKEREERTGISEDERYVRRCLKNEIDNGKFACDRLAAIKLFMELAGLFKKPVNPAMMVNVTPKVIEVPAFNNAEEWASYTQMQQTQLLNVARDKH